MKSYKLDHLECKTIEEFLSTFNPPNTYEIYDNVNDRSAVLNKFNFSQEIVYSKDPQKESLIKKLTNDTNIFNDEISYLNSNLKNIDDSITSLNASNKVKEINIEIEKIINHHNSIKPDALNRDLFSQHSPIFSSSASEAHLEYMESLGLKYSTNIPQDKLDVLKKDLESGKISKETYKTKYENLVLLNTKLDVSDKYLDNLFNVYFKLIKPSIQITPLNWLHKSHIFHESNPDVIINDLEKHNRKIKAYNRDDGENSYIETFVANETREVQLQVDAKNYAIDLPIDSEVDEKHTKRDYILEDKKRDGTQSMWIKYHHPIYDYDDLIKRKDMVLNSLGLGHLYKDTPLYLDHLKFPYEKTARDILYGNKEHPEYFPEKNLFYLQNGYKKDSKTDFLVSGLKKLKIKNKTLLDINNLDELNNDFTKEEKLKFFLNLISSIFNIDLKYKLVHLHKKDVNDTISLANSYAIGEYKLGRVALDNKNLNDSSKILVFDNESYNIKYEKSLKNENLKSQSNKIAFHRYKTNVLYQEEALQSIDKNDQVFLTKNNYKENFGYGSKEISVLYKEKYGEDLIGINPTTGFKTNQIKGYSSLIKAEELFEKRIINGKYKFYGISKPYFSEKDPEDAMYGKIIRFKQIFLEDENGSIKKLDFDYIMNKYKEVEPILDLDNTKDGFVMEDLYSYFYKSFEGNSLILNQSDIDNLWDKGLTLEEDFDIIHLFYMEVLQTIHEYKELDKMILLDKIWNDVYKTWYDMENDKIDFWNKVTKKVTNKIRFNEGSFETFYSQTQNLLTEVYEDLLNQYGSLRGSSNFYNGLNINQLIFDIISLDKEIMYEEYKTKNFKIEKGYNDQENYINMGFLNKAFQEKDILKHYDEAFQSGMSTILEKFDYRPSVLGREGRAIAEKLMGFFYNKFKPSNRPKEVNLLNVYYEETKELLKEMTEKYGKKFLETKRPPYFPTVKYMILNRNVSFERNEGLKNTNLLKYYDSKIKPLFDLEAMEKKYELPEYSISYNNKIKFKSFMPIDKEIKDSFFIAKVLSGVEFVKEKGQNLAKVVELETNRAKLVEEHNKLANGFKEFQDKRNNLLPKYKDTVKKIKDLKIENYVVTNNIDREKFITTMKAIVDMTLNQVNRDKIIDLTKLDNLDNAMKEFEDKISELHLIPKSALITEYSTHINDLYEKRGLTDKFNYLEIDELKKGMIQRKHFFDYEEHFKNHLIENGENEKREKQYKYKVYEGNHIPLFIDKESLTIWTVEWTTKYPTLNIFTMSPEFLMIENDNKLYEDYFTKVDTLDKFFEEEMYPNATEEELKQIRLNSITKKKLSDELSFYLSNEKFFPTEKVEKTQLDILDRVKEIFSLIQTNYFIQLEETEDKALFLDVDSNYIYDSKPNMGAVPFMTKTDEQLLEKYVFNVDTNIFNNKLIKYINPFNYQEDDKVRYMMIHKSKTDGYKAEEKSKKNMQNFKNNILKEKETLELNKQSSKGYAYTYEMLYARNNYGTKQKQFNPNLQVTDQQVNEYDGNPNLIKIFKTLEELENYKKHYDEVLNREMKFDNVCA